MPPILLVLPLLAQFSGQIGVGVGECTEGNRARVMVDLGKGFRPFQQFNGGGAAPVDDHGWPVSDGSTVLFDIRPTFAWAPPIDDPDQFQPDWSGRYALSFQGNADFKATGSSGLSIENVTYVAETNTTTADLIVPAGAGLVVLEFRNTRRTPDGDAGTGITNLHVIRPGYSADTNQIFTTEFLKSLEPFSTVRFMGFTATNDTGPRFTDDDNQLHWSNRHTPDDATQQSYGGKFGCAWEYVVGIGNAGHKDIWIDIPVAADEDYVRSLAWLIHDTLDPALNVYIEHSNEVWNPGFRQYTYNQSAAVAEVNAVASSNLNLPATTDRLEWGRRRHARRLIEIGEIFRGVFGTDALNQRIRLVHSWWTIRPAEYDRVLAWVEQNYGPAADRFWAIAKTQYFDTGAVRADASTDDVIAALQRSSDSQRVYTQQIATVAGKYGLRLAAYEGGPGDNVGSTAALAARIRAHRDPRMRELVRRDLAENWYPLGGDLHMYLEIASAYSRFGCWGLTEDIVNLDTPKLNGVKDLVQP